MAVIRDEGQLAERSSHRKLNYRFCACKKQKDDGYNRGEHAEQESQRMLKFWMAVSRQPDR
jgi:hypothetical protein